jgi:ABC-2 type transport system ATP-binding protein
MSLQFHIFNEEVPLNPDSPAANLPCAIQIRGLSKTYKTGFWLRPKVAQALKNLHLDIYENQAFGLMGLNGAGKTTVIKLVLGLLKSTSGDISVLGGRISSRSVRQQIGYLSELPYFSKQHTGRELLEYFGALHGLHGAALHHRVDEILEMVRMAPAARQKVSDYSKGMLQRIGIGQALIGKPRLLICDEPMSGLDPVGYKEMRDIFIDLKKTGTTLFLNTHILDEVERICDRIGILHEGVLKESVPISKILESSVPVDYWIDVEGAEASKLSGLPFQDAIHKNGGVQVAGLVLAETLSLLTSRKAKVKAVRPLSSLVEAYFLKAIGAQAHLNRSVEGDKP